LNADIFSIARDIMFQGWEYYYKNPEKFFFIKKFLNSSHLSRIAKQEVEKELQPIFDFYDAGKKQDRIIDIDNKLLFDMVT
jgi:hypothetical protein